MTELPVVQHAPDSAPPAFRWDDWYMSVGGRSINDPEVDAILKDIFEKQFPRFAGSPAPEQRNFASPQEAAEHIKHLARRAGADLVGICELEATDMYRGRRVEERYAIALGKRMRYRAFQKVPSRESALECVRIYHELGEICIALAQEIRALGWQAVVEHPIGDSNVLHIPIGLKAGFGELGRHGSIINPELGPLFRMGSVLCSIPLETDSPIDAGIAAFCDKCRACRIYCPADAIPDEREHSAGKDHLGNDRYLVDTGKCFPYFSKHYYCSICLPVCVYNHKEWARDFEGHTTKLFPEVTLEEPPPPCDAVAPEHKHYYPQVKRDKQAQERAARVRKTRRLNTHAG